MEIDNKTLPWWQRGKYPDAMSPKPKPACEQTRSFLRAHRVHLLGACTGQDLRALDAFAHLLSLYAAADASGREAAIEAMRDVLRAMQPHTRDAAKRAILSQLDWPDEEPLWARIIGLTTTQEIP